MELQSAKQRFEQRGVKLAAISYDTVAILKDFAERHKIDFPLLADPESKIITAYKVLNQQATGTEKGMAHPGYFFIDSDGVIREKYFEAKYTDRFTANNVYGKLFPELTREAAANVQAPHLSLKLTQSDREVAAGSRVTLIAEISLPPDVHVYSPGVRGYRPLQLNLHPSGGIVLAPVVYPQSKTLFLEAIHEQVPVFEGTFHVTQDVTVNLSKAGDGLRAVFGSEKTISIAGDLQYQACDKTTCFTPSSVPVKWELKVQPLDLQRSPRGIRHK